MNLINFYNGIFQRDQLMWDNFSEDQKIGFSRLILEVVKADEVILNIELIHLPVIHKNYLILANDVSLEDAYSKLNGISNSDKERIVKELEEASNGDFHKSSEETDVIKNVREMLQNI